MTKSFFLTISILLFFALAQAQYNFTLVSAGLTDLYEGGGTEFELADIDQDGDIDMISVGDHMSPLYTNEYGIMVFRNNGNGTNWVKNMFGDFGYGGVAVGDVNNDGFLDVGYGVHHNYGNTDLGDQRLEVVLGNGIGYSWFPYDDNLANQGQTWGMSACDFADVDNDGLLDLGATSFGSPDGIWIFKNTGLGSWDVMSGALGGNSNNNFKFGDFNNDGKADYIANHSQTNGYPMIGDGTGSFAPLSNAWPVVTPYNYVFEFDIADVNKDGASDIALVSNGIPKVYSFNLNTMAWVSISNGLPSTNQSFQSVALGDVNYDGNTDLVTFKSGLFITYQGDGNGNWSFADSLPVSESSCRDLKLADFNRNGFLDISYWGSQSSNIVRVYLDQTVNNQVDIKAVFPKGREAFCGNSIQFVKWQSKAPNTATSSVKIELSTSGPTGPFNTVVTSAPNNGTYQWAVPQEESNNCYFRFIVTAGALSDTIISDTAFSINPCVKNPIIPGDILGANYLCKLGDTIIYSVPKAYGATDYSWTLPSGWQGNSTSDTIQVITSSGGGTLTVVANTATGFSNPKALNISFIVPDTSLQLLSTTLIANDPNASYQWYNCGTQQILLGDTLQQFTATANGYYAAIINSFGCVDTSACYHINSVSIDFPTQNLRVKIYPNPSNGIYELSAPCRIDHVEIFNLMGEIIHLEKQVEAASILDLSRESKGVYFVKITIQNQSYFTKLIKQ